MTLRWISSPAVLFTTLALTTAGCGSDTPTGPTDPGDTPVEITESFPASGPGTLTPNGGITHIFGVQRAGRITATLTTLAPDSSVRLGLNLGSWNGVACTQHITKDDATQGTTIIGEATATGNYCIRIFDSAGTLTGPVEYQTTVTHF